VTTRLVLRLPDRADATLAGIAVRAVPAVMPPGRALLAPDGTEVQLAHAGSEPTRAALIAAVHACAARSTRTPTALRLRSLPTMLDLSELPAPGETTPFAVSAPRCRPIGLPLTRPTRLLVAGPARSGRSTTLDTLLHQAVRAGQPISVIAPARSPVRAAAVRLGVPVVDPADEPSVVERLGGILLVDDSDDFAGSGLDDALVQRARQATPAMVVSARIEDAARAYRGLAVEIRRSRCALLLQPGPLDGELVGVRLRPGMCGGPPGRGVLVGDPAWDDGCAGAPARVQVATAGQPICG
jgi:S-DNA-T family DNA segregation ATPase FtsK/SpoIIIE